VSKTGQRLGAYSGSWATLRRTTPFTDGQACIRCRKPIRYWHKRDLDHAYPVYLFGGHGPVAWSHRKCNRRHGGRAGAAKTNRLRHARRAAGLPDTRAQGLRTTAAKPKTGSLMSDASRAKARKKWGT
jgi:hypothetical protein